MEKLPFRECGTRILGTRHKYKNLHNKPQSLKQPLNPKPDTLKHEPVGLLKALGVSQQGLLGDLLVLRRKSRRNVVQVSGPLVWVLEVVGLLFGMPVTTPVCPAAFWAVRSRGLCACLQVKGSSGSRGFGPCPGLVYVGVQDRCVAHFLACAAMGGASLLKT